MRTVTGIAALAALVLIAVVVFASSESEPAKSAEHKWEVRVFGPYADAKGDVIDFAHSQRKPMVAPHGRDSERLIVTCDHLGKEVIYYVGANWTVSVVEK